MHGIDATFQKMPCLSRKYLFFLLFIVWLAFISTAEALPVGGILHVKPQVEVRAEKKKGWTVAGERYALTYGDYIRTDKNGKADVLFNDGTEIVLRNNSQIQIVAPSSETQPLVVRVFGALSEILVRARGKTEIRTAACNAAVRGTQFLIRLPSEEQTTLTVLEGAVDFYNPQGSVIVNADQQSSARVGGAPTPPVAVDVTGLLSWSAEMSGLPVEFEAPMTSVAPSELAPQRKLAEDAVHANPADATPHLRLARLLYDSGAYSAAVQEFDKAVALAPGDVSALIDLGNASQAGGDILHSKQAFAQALQLAPENAEAHGALVLTLIAGGAYADAHTRLDGMADSARTQALRGLLALREGHPEEAAQQLTAAVNADATDYQACALLALARLTLNQLPAAEAAARRAVTLQPRGSQTQAALAMVLFFENKNREAAMAANRALSLNPYSPFVLLTQGRLLEAQGQLVAARNAFQQTQALAPDLPLVYTELGQVYLRLGLLPKAEAAFRKALALHVVSPDAHTGLGVCLQLQGKTSEAIAEHQQALALDANNAVARVNLAALYTELGQLAKAEAVLLPVRAEAPEHGLVYARLAVINLYRQHVFAAQTYARRAVALLPRSAIAHFVLGQVYQEQNRLTQAGEEFRFAATLDPQYAPARYALGVVRSILETGLDLSHPLGAVDAANQSSPTQGAHRAEPPGARHGRSHAGSHRRSYRGARRLARVWRFAVGCRGRR